MIKTKFAYTGETMKLASRSLGLEALIKEAAKEGFAYEKQVLELEKDTQGFEEDAKPYVKSAYEIIKDNIDER